MLGLESVVEGTLNETVQFQTIFATWDTSTPLRSTSDIISRDGVSRGRVKDLGGLLVCTDFPLSMTISCITVTVILSSLGSMGEAQIVPGRKDVVINAWAVTAPLLWRLSGVKS